MSDVPAHRCFLSIELPFCVRPSRQVCENTISEQTSLSPGDRKNKSLNETLSSVGRKINSFLPSPVLHEFLQRGTTDAAPPPMVSNTSASRAFDASSLVEDDSEGAEHVTGHGLSSMARKQNRRGGVVHEKEYHIASPMRYNPDPIFSAWCGTDWASEDDSTDAEKGHPEVLMPSGGMDIPPQSRIGPQDNVDHHSLNNIVSQDGNSDHTAECFSSTTSAKKPMSLPSSVLPEKKNELLFASTTPQLLINGYSRNDIVLKVMRHTRVKRVRCKKTGAVLQEKEIDSSDEDENVISPIYSGKDGSEGKGKRKIPRLDAKVVGVISRELELSRPADFTFSLFTEEERAMAPHLCNGDVFPPAHYLQEKATIETTYEMGKDMNASVLNAETVTAPTLHGVQAFETGEIPLLMVNPTDEVLPPPQSESQLQFLSRMGSSSNGLSPEDPEEIRTVARLLEARPVWSMAMLSEAAWQTGLCPRRYLTKRVIHCLTYVIPIGAFNRLRIRLDYNPYLSPISVMYQRLTVRLVRRSEVGMLLRDISRSEHIEDVIHQIRNDPENPIPTPWIVSTVHGSSPPSPFDITRIPRCGLREHFCQTILRGQLSISFQLVDLMELESYQRAVSYVIAKAGGGKTDASGGLLGGPLPKELRSTPHGWLTEQASSQAISQYSSALAQFIQSEVVPRLKAYNEQKDISSLESSGGGDWSEIPTKKGLMSTPQEMDNEVHNDDDDNNSDTDDSETSIESDTGSNFSVRSSLLSGDVSEISSEASFLED